MDIAAYAERLIVARQSGLPVAPGPEPTNRAEAFAAQAASAPALGGAIAGWKVADHPELGPVAAPIFASLSKPNGASWALVPGLAVEIEVALRLKRDLPRGEYSREAILDAVDQVRLGVEMVGTRMAPDNRNLYANLADLMANAGYVMGETSGLWQDAPIAGRRCVLSLDGAVIHDAPAAPPALDPLAVTAKWLSHADDACGGFRAGQFITTGSLCGVLPITRRGRAVASLDGFGTAEILIT
jgi:2-keto-4-pentenoate hydratase